MGKLARATSHGLSKSSTCKGYVRHRAQSSQCYLKTNSNIISSAAQYLGDYVLIMSMPCMVAHVRASLGTTYSSDWRRMTAIHHATIWHRIVAAYRRSLHRHVYRLKPMVSTCVIFRPRRRDAPAIMRSCCKMAIAWLAAMAVYVAM